MEEKILIPNERIAVLIGEKGRTRRQLEKKGKIKLIIDSKANEVTIKGEDAVDVFIGQKVVEAIGRGFNPIKAQKLFKEGMVYESVSLGDFGAKSKKDLQRLRSLVIGTEGKSKRIIQGYTKTSISVFGKTVGVIGAPQDVMTAMRAIEMLLTGSSHGSVFHFLEDSTKP